MNPAALGLVVLAAALHAGWNALAKAGGDPVVFLWLANVIGVVGLAPFAIAIAARDGVSATALPFVAATSVLHALYFYALGRSYRTGDLSLVYPLARGLGVALVPILAVTTSGERVSAPGALGIALVVGGLLVLHAGPLAAHAAASGVLHVAGATRWAALTGLVIACYSVVDAAGVLRMSPLLYLALGQLGVLILLGPVVAQSPAALRQEWRTRRWTILVAGLASVAAYTLILYAFQSAKVGYVVAARECSIVFSTLIGTLWFREGRLKTRLAAAAVILAGVACVVVAR